MLITNNEVVLNNVIISFLLVLFFAVCINLTFVILYNFNIAVGRITLNLICAITYSYVFMRLYLINKETNECILLNIKYIYICSPAFILIYSIIKSYLIIGEIHAGFFGAVITGFLVYCFGFLISYIVLMKPFKE